MAFDLIFRDGGFYILHSGQVTLDEINEVNGLIHGDPRFDEHRFQVIDLLDADFAGVRLQDSRIPAATDYAASRSRETVKVAILATDETAIRFCRQYVDTAERMGSRWSFRFFEDRDDADAWIRP